MQGVKILKFIFSFLPIIIIGIYGILNTNQLADIFTVIFSIFTAWFFLIRK